MPRLPAVFRPLREAPRFAAAVLLTLAAGCGVALALLGLAGAGIGYAPPTVFPTWDRGAGGPGWTETLGTVAAMRHTGIVALLGALRGATVMVLASACVVAATLVLGRGVARRQGITLRVVLGAAPVRIFREAMADAGAPVIAGCALGLALGVAAARGLGASWPGADPWTRALPPAGRRRRWRSGSRSPCSWRARSRRSSARSGATSPRGSPPATARRPAPSRGGSAASSRSRSSRCRWRSSWAPAL
jgi:hypothetical protein